MNKHLFTFNFNTLKTFIFKTSLFCLASIIITCCLIFTIDGRSDPFYLRFTTKKQSSLILGTSRAAQGIVPSIFRDSLNIDIYNYAFTVGHSPYGPVYLESIKKKLDTKNKNNIYILAVDPWAISSWCEEPDNINQFRENKLCLSYINNVNSLPNFEFIYNYDQSPYNLFLKKTKMLLHTDGWLEVEINKSEISNSSRLKKEETYRQEHLPRTKFSTVRFQYLQKTINYLNQFGEVYLVRIPIHDKILQIENDLNFDFNEKITLLKGYKNYYDFTLIRNQFLFTDGNHLHRSSSKDFSKILVSTLIKDNL
ncbi:hypothetical protein [Flammeovirga pacifica]|uniref:DUF1574 domain-containing protein n=1 Tax=Flammeovirga pacifica TaxID=915059 RepID=A0A1S1YWZ5_FLAPC|nr:hypothetical protein [Flammeovirga pacifica]OHX65549.1 hypothetical protein NH26_03895 [Flammeovirga pacifica]